MLATKLASEIRQTNQPLQSYLASHLEALVSHRIVRHILPVLFLGPNSESRLDRFHHRVSTITQTT